MGVKWTEEQQKVIDLRDRNILVSAAAGSGKTAVLVERIIRRLTSADDPMDVDRLLIVTFTEAAAAEMRERIGAAIEKQLEERPGDVHLERQATLIHSAPITTIHSFCLSVIRDHFHVIGIDPGFRVAEEGELKLLKQDVLEELLEACYAEENEGFLSFVERFGTGRNDKKIEGIILKLYEYSRSYPQPKKWLDSCVDAYKSQNTELARRAVSRAGHKSRGLRKILELAIKVCEEPDGPYMYGDALDSDLIQAEKLEKCMDYDSMYTAVSGFQWKRLSSKKDDTVSPEKKEEVKKLREQAKKMFTELKETYFYAPREQWEQTMANAAGSMEILAALVKKFSAMFDEKKRSRNMIDFNDMEQFALAILTVEEEGKLVPSPAAAEYQDQFDEVMIDEYQDSNLVQEAILTSVSGVSRGRYNIFMVGDVKQSIYSFRLSRPELFMEKYHTYSLEDGSKQRIDLHKNFRSRKEVLGSVNHIFRRIMKSDLGGIEYDDSAALYPGAAFPAMEEKSGEKTGVPFRTELLILEKDGAKGRDERRAEAGMIARRIKELLLNGMVTDKETGGYRKVQYRDIVILTRSIRGWAEDISSVLAEEGIPAYSVSREGYFETYEVSVLLDYLKILDNARQDLPLAAVLTSCFCGLDERELAQIRLAFPDVTFYEAAASYAEGDGSQSGLQKKLQDFYVRLEYFRKKVPYTPIHDLLAEIIEKTGYDIWITAMPGGAQRAANVEMLSEKAAAFEGTSYKGLFNFVRYIEQLKKYDVDYGEAGIFDEQSDTVRIMSIHKSKGLEFPVVFAAGMGKRFNTQDTKGSMILHPEWGAGLDDIDIERRTKAPTFLKKMIQKETLLETLAEEQRILYVALTRAKEKLIMTGCADSETMEAAERGRVLLPSDARSYLDWILPAVSGEAAAGADSGCPEEEKVEIRIFNMEDLAGDAVEEKAEELAQDVLRNWDCTNIYDPKFRESLNEQMEYVYPYEEEGRMKLKFTVSELKKRASLTEESGQEMYEEPEVVPLIPKFLQKEEEGLTGAPRGSAYHKLLELLDFRKTYNEKTLMETVENFRREGRLSDEMAECVRPGDVLKFLNCESGRRMSASALKGRLFREQPFVLGVDASEIYPGDQSGETILVQGIIDVYFEEPDGLVVLDYKTDRVSRASQLEEKYHAQLDYYAEALEKLLDKPVKEKIIYSFTLGEEIRV